MGSVRAWMVAVFASLVLAAPAGLRAAATPAAQHDSVPHLGVASCGGSTCHGRQEATGPRVRQNERLTWADPASLTGAHARAWKILGAPRARAIGDRLGIADVSASRDCTACHGDPAPNRGAQFQQSDGVGCEACHGGAGGKAGWLAGHAAGASHADNVANGLWAIDRPALRANLCLDCHFGSAKPGQFVTHRIMAAGHPRLSFELDLFTSLQAHHDEDRDYAARKRIAGGVQTWAIGQALAVERALTLYPARSAGAFPEFVFFDCRSCHRSFSDDPAVALVARRNAARPMPPGQPLWNDENMLLLAAAASVAAPTLAPQLERQSRALHASFGIGRTDALAAGAALSRTAAQLAAQFERGRFGKAETLAMLDAVLVRNADRYTDYQGGTQAVMAADTLLAALVAAGQADRAAVLALRPDLDRAYAAARDANAWSPPAFRAALAGIAARVRQLA
ncbi:MAG: hypothetical protein CFE37_00545 [Alphaproteobacteria bacterium PA4]|nr:MAG: hypothetical protein CFE37_00545 [Alphaproteobacteria bacterium PA4]